LNVLYRYADDQGYFRQGVASAFSNARKNRTDADHQALADDKFKKLADGTMFIEKTEKDKGKLTILRANYGPSRPPPPAGWSRASSVCSSASTPSAPASASGWR